MHEGHIGVSLPLPNDRTLPLAFFKLCQHLCGFIWVQLCTQWYVLGVFVAASGFLWFPMGPWSTLVDLRPPSACTCGFT